jgi:hypothetical protein
MQPADHVGLTQQIAATRCKQAEAGGGRAGRISPRVCSLRRRSSRVEPELNKRKEFHLFHRLRVSHPCPYGRVRALGDASLIHALPVDGDGEIIGNIDTFGRLSGAECRAIMDGMHK